jgi:hypothetical protein
VSYLINETAMLAPYDVFVSGNYAYIAGADSDTFAIVDVSNKTSPSVVSYLINATVMDNPTGVFVSGKYAYVTGSSSNSLVVIDIYGTELTSLEVGNIKTGSIDVSDYALFGNGIHVKGGINGDDLLINGDASISGFLKHQIKILSSISGFTSFTALDRFYIGGGLDWDFQNIELFSTIFGKLGVAPTTPYDGQVWHDDLGLNAFVNNRTSHFTPKDVVYVHSLADFPDKQVDGYIHLEEKHYIIMEQVILDGSLGYNGFYFEKDLSPMITGFRTIGYEKQNPFANDALFKSDDLGGGLVLLNNLNVYSEGSGRLFKINSSDGTGFLVLNTFAVGGFFDLGIVEDISYFGFVVNYVQNLVGGLKLINNSAVAVQSHRFNDWITTPYGTATFLTVEGTQQSIQINNNFFQPNVSENSLYLHPNLTTSGGSVVGNVFDLTKNGSIFQSGSKDQMDIYWTYAGNSNLADSTAVGFMSFFKQNNLTSVPVTNTPYVINATWTLEENERFSFDEIGTFNYTGLETINALLQATVTLDPTSGAATTWHMHLRKNGVIINSSIAPNQIQGGATLSFTSWTKQELKTGDSFDIIVERVVGTGDVVGTYGNFMIVKT